VNVQSFPRYGRGKLSTEENAAIITGISSVFLRLRNAYAEIQPIFQKYGLKAQSPGLVARDLSEQCEIAIRQHCATFSEGRNYCDLARGSEDWEVKVCRDSGLTINQSTTVENKNYIVTNYLSTESIASITRIFILWDAADVFFSPRKRNSNARALRIGAAERNIQVLFGSRRGEKSEQPAQLGLGLSP
jgi:hypothetical protein